MSPLRNDRLPRDAGVPELRREHRLPLPLALLRARGAGRHDGRRRRAGCAARNWSWQCNWLVADDDESGRCFACRLIRRRPDSDDTIALEKLADTGVDLRRLLVQLFALGLPVVPYYEREGGLAFDLLSSRSGESGRDRARRRRHHDRPGGDPGRPPRGAARATRRAVPHDARPLPPRGRPLLPAGAGRGRAAAQRVPGAVRRRARQLRRGPRAALPARSPRGLGRQLHLGVRHDAPVGGLRRDLRPLPAHHRHARDGGSGRRRAGLRPRRRGHPPRRRPGRRLLASWASTGP